MSSGTDDNGRGWGRLPRARDFGKFLVLYLTLATISLGTIVGTGAVVSPVYILVGVLGAMILLGIYHFLENNRHLQAAYGVVIHLSIFVLAIQEIRGKLAIVVGLCLGTIAVGYWRGYVSAHSKSSGFGSPVGVVVQSPVYIYSNCKRCPVDK
ncbi:hypothetical protein [Halocatena halophila]|uniref:hypothetical protein n=1 Tax=Halocatena halophila TaxID=2814576 RepID=UPI002ED6950B